LPEFLKAASITALWLLGALEGVPQGQIVFDNHVNGVVVAPVFGPEPTNPELIKQGTTNYGGPPLQGIGYTAQLFGGPTNIAVTNLQAILPPVLFQTGANAGFVEPPDFAVAVPGVPEGMRAKLQLRVWDNNNGALTNWSQVRTNRFVARGESLPFIGSPLGGSLTVPPNLQGLESFNIAIPAGVAALLPLAPANLVLSTISSTQLDLSWQDMATNELGFGIEQSLDGLAFALFATTPSNVTTFSAMDLRPGLRYYSRVRAFNDTGQSGYSNTNYASTRTPFAQWQITHFSPTQLTNTSVAGLTADPDGDRLPNFAEHGLNRSPLSDDGAAAGEAVIDQLPGSSNHLAIVYARSRAAIDVSFSAAVSSNFVSWQSGSNRVMGPILLSETATNVIEKFRSTIPMSGASQEFLRLVVTYTGVRDSWETNISMPLPLDEVACGIIGHRLYVVGGGNSATMAFDVFAGRWTNLNAPRPFVGNHHAAEVFNGKFYLFGGLGASSGGRVQIYDPAVNSWSLGAAMPFAAGSCASAVISNQIYVAGGVVGSATTNGLARYNPLSNTWTNLAPMPLGRNHTASATDSVRFFIFGGRGGGNAVANGSDTVQIYDPADNSWISSSNPGSAIAPLPQSRGGMGKAVFFNGEFYVMGGETSSGPGATAQRVYNRVDIYNPAANTWRAGTPMLTARHGIYPVLNGIRVYVAGGGVVAGASSSALLEVYITPE
jgi:N-acetylneuraminic acid mutarotase